MRDNPLVPLPAKVLARTEEAPGSFTLTVKYESRHSPGQFVQLSLPGAGECPISIASYNHQTMELNINKVGNVTAALERVNAGDTVFIRGPYGNGYPMKELIGKNLILVGGGCGAASIRGIVHYLKSHLRDYGKIRSFMGFRSHDLILFRREINSWKETGELNISLDTANGINDKPDVKNVEVQAGSARLTCEVGFVTKMLAEAKFHTENTAVLMCGPPLMIKFSLQALKKHGFKDNQIYVSAERLMYCGIGKCCHCMIHGRFTCIDGPVFRLDELGGDIG